MRILLVENYLPIREHVKIMINETKDLHVIAEVGSGEEAIEMVKRLKPDVVIMDIMLSGMTGILTIRRILSEHPSTRILALSGFSASTLAQSVFDAGGHGYVCKNRASEELIAAIRKVGNGESYISNTAHETRSG